MSDVIVVDYDPSWPGLFDGLKESVWPAVADIAISVEHVGSTAVPGLAAKAVIDLDVVVPADAVEVGIARLVDLGYEHVGDLGISGREAFRRPADTVAHHLYLCPSTSLALANHLAIRDHLRTNAAEARAYGELKKRLARQFSDDIDGYVEGKSGFLLGILRSVGFAKDDLDDVEAMNRA